jgi:hypothetical protein
MNIVSRRLITGVFLLALPLLSGARAAEAQSLTASFIYPTDGAVNVNMSTPIQWTSVAGAQAYYLYLGSTLGAKDLANSGELQQTSYTAVNVPAGLVYARLWTKVTGQWRSIDITFTAAAPAAIAFTYPPAGASSADMSQPFQWTPVTNATAYYLYIGTSVGLKDIVDTGEIAATSYLAYNLPLNQPLYCRLWARANGSWRYIDRVITATATTYQIAHFINPTNGAANVDMSQPIAWSTALNADKYYLYVGSTLGANDLVNSGETTATSYLAPNLPSGQTLYARLWTHVSGLWKSTDITFTAAAAQSNVVPTFIYPTNGITMDISLGFSWTAVPNVQAYYLYVGTTQGSNNVINSGEILATSYPSWNLPTTGTFYARIYSKVAGVWRYSDIVFSTSPLTASLITPANGSTGFDASVTSFQWTSVSIAQKYYLYVGTSPGAKDVIDSQEMCNFAGCNGGPLATTWNGLQGGKSPATGLSQYVNATLLYARLWTMVDGVFRYVDSTFTTAQLVPVILDPLDNSTKDSVHQVYTFLAPTNSTAFRVTVQYLCDATHACTPDQQTTLLEDSGILAPTDLKYSKQTGAYQYTAQKEAPQTKLVAIVYAFVNGSWRTAQVTYTHSRIL